MNCEVLMDRLGHEVFRHAFNVCIMDSLSNICNGREEGVQALFIRASLQQIRKVLITIFDFNSRLDDLFEEVQDVLVDQVDVLDLVAHVV